MTIDNPLGAGLLSICDYRRDNPSTFTQLINVQNTIFLSYVRSVQNLTVISAIAWTDVLFVLKAVEVKPQTATEVLKALQGDDTLQGGMMPSQLTAMMIGCPEAIRWLQKANDLTRLVVGWVNFTQKLPLHQKAIRV